MIMIILSAPVPVLSGVMSLFIIMGIIYLMASNAYRKRKMATEIAEKLVSSLTLRAEEEPEEVSGF